MAENQIPAVGQASEQTKSCPFCAEQIHINAIKCKHCGESLTALVCDTCNVALQTRQEKDQVSLAGCLGILMFLAGLLAFIFVHWIGGVVLATLGIACSVLLRGSHDVLVCPRCGGKFRAPD